MRCVFIKDPSLEKVAIKLDIHPGFSKDPQDLNGLCHVSRSMFGWGSARYPGPKNFESFVNRNEIDFQMATYYNLCQMFAEVPKYAVTEYLDRLSDMLASPDISDETLELAKNKIARTFYPGLNNSKYRQAQIVEYLHFGRLFKFSILFQRKDLLTHIKEFIDYYFRPSNMIIYIMGGFQPAYIHDLAARKFEKLNNGIVNPLPKSLHGPFASNIDFADTVRQGDHALIAWAFSRSDVRELTISLRLPRGADHSAAMYFAYLFNMSQPGSLQYRLKSLDLVEEIYTVQYTYSVDFETIVMMISPTLRGIRNVCVIVSYVQGYIEKIKCMVPSESFSEQAREYFKCIDLIEIPVNKLQHYASRLWKGDGVDSLRYANIPEHFDKFRFQEIVNNLSLRDFDIVAMSRDYVQGKTHTDTDYFLQFSVENLDSKPRFDGLMEPLLEDPLATSSRQPVVFDSNLDIISKSPIAYQQSSSKQLFTTLEIGVKSSEFAKFSSPAQRLYAKLVSHNLSLITVKHIFELHVEVNDNIVYVFLKSFPYSLLPLMTLLVKILSTPLNAAIYDKFTEFKEAELGLMRLWLSGDSQVGYDSHFEKIIGCDLDIDKQLSELEAVKSLHDLPRSVHGELALLFGGNINRSLSLSATSIISCLHV